MTKIILNGEAKLNLEEKEIVIKSKAYNDILKRLDSKWEHISYSDVELKQIAKDLFNQKIFCNLHIDSNNSSIIYSIFMPLIFMGHIAWSTNETRESKLIKLLLEDKEEEYKQRYDAWLKEVGLIYEYYDKAMPSSINGMPTFGSARFLNKIDAKKVLDYHDKYKELQDKIDNML